MKFEVQALSRSGKISLREPPCGGKLSAGIITDQQPFLLFIFLFSLSMAKNLAAAFNFWAREGQDMLGGADGAALENLLSEFMADPGSSSEDSESMS